MAKNVFMILFLITALLHLSGCGVMVHDSFISNYQELDKVIEKEITPKQGYGRLVIYYPRLDMEGFALVGVGGLNEVTLNINSNKCDAKLRILDETGIFLDVPAGTYSVLDEDVSKDVKVDVLSGTVHYIKIQCNPGMFNKEGPVEVSAEQALSEMKAGKIKAQALSPDVAPIYKTGYHLVPQNRPADLEKGKIYVFRDSGLVGAVVPIRIGLDSEPHLGLKNKKYICIEVQPGEYAITTAFKKGLGGKVDIYRVGRKVSVSKGENTYIIIEDITDLGKVRFLDEIQAQKYLKKCKRTEGNVFVPIKE